MIALVAIFVVLGFATVLSVIAAELEDKDTFEEVEDDDEFDKI